MGSVSSFIPTVSGIKPVCQGAPIPLNFLQHKISPLWLLSRCVWRAHSLNTLGESGCCFPWKMASLHKNWKTWNRCRQLSQWLLELISMSRLSLFHLVLIIAQCFVFDPLMSWWVLRAQCVLALRSQIRSAMLANAIDDEPIIDMKDSLSGTSVKFDPHWESQGHNRQSFV